MSRYYRIVIGAETAAPITPGAVASNNAGAEWTNQVNGKADLGAQTVEIDAWQTTFFAPAAPAYIAIWGPTREQISQAMDFNGAHIDVYAGMQKGLPLATDQAPHAGLIVSGQVFQSFGNWQGVNQTLNFVVVSDINYTQSQPGNLVLCCLKGQRLGDAIQQMLQIAYPGYTIKMNVGTNLVLPQDTYHVSDTLQQFAAYVKQLSQQIVGGSYPGIDITQRAKVITIFDSAIPADGGAAAVTQIGVQDLVGAPTWLGAFTVSFTTVMRADLQVGSLIEFPPIAGVIAQTTPNSESNARAANTFKGQWQISSMRHIGNSRAPDAQSWVTVFQAYSLTAPAAIVSPANTAA